MARKLQTARDDDRIQRALQDPKTYFAKARERAQREVRAEMARERSRSQVRRKLAT